MTRKTFLKMASLAAGTAIRSRSAAANGVPDAQSDRAAAPAKRSFPSGATTAIAAFIEQTSYATIPEPAIVEARRCLIDGLGVVLAGATVRGSAIVREYVRSLDEPAPADSAGGGGGATVLGPER